MQQGADQPGQAHQSLLVTIVAAATDALTFTQGLDEAALAELAKADRRTFRAVRDALVEMSLQVKQLPPEFRGKHDEVWSGVRKLGGIAIDANFAVVLPLIWPSASAFLHLVINIAEKELGRSQRASIQPYPSPAAWRQFIAGLREAKRHLLTLPEPEASGSNLEAVSRVLIALYAFLEAHPVITAEELHRPFRMLLVAIANLGQGYNPSLLKPWPRRKPKGIAEQGLIATAALALDEMVRMGEPLAQAAAKVARTIAAAKHQVRPRGDAMLADTVRGWRERLMEGEGSAPSLALFLWRDYHGDPGRFGTTPNERVRWLLGRIRHGSGLHWH